MYQSHKSFSGCQNRPNFPFYFFLLLASSTFTYTKSWTSWKFKQLVKILASSTFKIYFSATGQKISEFDFLLRFTDELTKKKTKKSWKDNFVIKNRKVIRKLITKINLKKFLAKFDFQKVIFKLNIKTLLETLWWKIRLIGVM